MNALPVAPAIGTRVTAPLWPHRTFRRRFRTITGRVTSVGVECLTVRSESGAVRTVRAMDVAR